ncbi:alpha-mannosidase [Cohnella yongneupensis]|uniref:Glycoside hydrolase family 38 C-terminal domain-containing protein n=1 Tax=Cohnella yongneupensis TaxID=425006 RepID=A0ABW0R9W1_9BACL
MHARERLFHIEKWLREKDRLIYRPIGQVALRYYEANEWMSCETAIAGPFGPIEPGTKWGEKWGYAWFRGSFTVPLEAAGERISLKLAFGAESTVYVNGKLAGAIDLQHDSITVTTSGVPGDVYEIVAEAYGGHDRGGQPELGRSVAHVVNEELYQFFIDLNVLYQLRNGLAPSELRVAEIDRGFSRLIAELDWSVSDPKLRGVALQGRAILNPLLACVNGSTAPKLFMMGQSHLDIAWLWPIEETKRKIARTMSNQLALLDQYPEYRYTQSQPYLFDLAKRLYPELYARIKKYVAEGRIIPEGGMWVEPDTNVPSGESMVRQFLYGKRFFREEFGVDNEMLWLPDVFGYSGNLPQIMRKSGIKYFASVKMFQTYDNVADPFPYNTFTWEGIDGSSVPVHLLDYGPFPNPTDVSYAQFQWNERIQKDGISTRLVQFGYGDGGGGANRDDLEFLRRMGDLEGVPRTVISSPIDYFEDQVARGMPDAHYAGELYYPAHRGTLTSQAKMKTGNRKTELLLREVELWSTIASLQGKLAYPKEALDDAWRTLLLLQFHDILPGTSITRVHVEAEREYERLLAEVGRLRSEAQAALTGGGGSAEDGTYTVFNSLPWERTAIVQLPTKAGEKASVPVRVQLPSMGYVTVSIAGDEAEAEVAVTATAAMAVPYAVHATPSSLENDKLAVRFNEYGEIFSLFDKESNSEWLQGTGNRFLMYRDQTSNYDAWEIDRRYASSRIDLSEPARMTVVAEQPHYATLRVERVLNRSVLIQEIRLEAGSRTVEFHTRIDWKEKHKLLKVGFETNLRSREALHEIQFGYVKRPTHLSRPHDADRFEVNQHKWSSLVEGDRCFSLLNDCKYGLNVLGQSMNLTLLRSPTYPDDRADEGVHEFVYALHVWNDGFMGNPVIRKAYELNCPVVAVPGSGSRFADQPAFELIKCDRDNVIIDTVKLAEDGSGDIVARLYEAKGASTRCAIVCGFETDRAGETDMMEQAELADISASGSNAYSLSFTPFEVKTIRFSLRN